MLKNTLSAFKVVSMNDSDLTVETCGCIFKHSALLSLMILLIISMLLVTMETIILMLIIGLRLGMLIMVGITIIGCYIRTISTMQRRIVTIYCFILIIVVMGVKIYIGMTVISTSF